MEETIKNVEVPSSNVSKQNDDGLDMKTLFVRSIPQDVTDEQLADFFSNFAPIKHAVVVKDTNKRSRGFGFVSFAVGDDTKEALAKARKTKFNGHILRVDIAKRRDRSKKTSEVVEKSTPELSEKITGQNNEDEDDADGEDSMLKGKPKLIIRNMPWSCRDPVKLKKIFGRYGTVVEATIPRKRDGKLCGFAFVTMKKISNCRIALENTKDLKIDGRKVAVDFAVQKNRWEDYKKAQPEMKDKDDNESGNEDAEENHDDEEEDENEEGDREVDQVSKNKESKRKAQNKREDFSVFVRNVPYDATEESLAAHFSKFGSVKYALPVIDKSTGLAKGTAFVAFKDQYTYNECIKNAPAAGSTSLLIGDDVMPEYVYEGRVLSITPTLVREDAGRMAEKNAAKRKEALGKAPGEKDRRNLYLLNEGRVIEGSKMADLLTNTDMEIREKSYKLRVEQLKKNPSLHLSMTRLAIRNLPRAMNDKALKALARKAVVEFATEVKNKERHPLSKEEIIRSTKEKYKFMGPDEIEAQKKKDKKSGVVKQAKVIMEVKGSTAGRSRGYGFVEFRDHKNALMGLRWLNCHAVTSDEILEGLNDEEKKQVDNDLGKGRHLCVEFAIENSNVVKRRREQLKQARTKRTRPDNEDTEDVGESENKKPKKEEATTPTNPDDKKMDDDIKRIIGFKRKRKHAKK
ncbi:XXYS1_4_G0021370.mRNA.1.CDS.1 [Saccharomyces cerevisiae]|nr:EM14S01-3B_G0018840.mRNA.1.CDS.1 [Saccharomyces cerevisiae]CAD6649906.1 XXYS1_4_G0021370.mRNA.1.CDS.1 [Saccharomyces cerevisiae]CAI4836094.1 CEI_1a_G0054460.mRNA.1.CDS.1 [Saccharomyces cerevisiae]CAI4842176.1 AMH_1a_G0054590.mRNA.1.CDS.1 [Saccharomyces cerevisiae]CAI6905387.1 AMH_1a_G0054590.mRNA.1.CDS.1 [Saccharomyces cerevisiae]